MRFFKSLAAASVAYTSVLGGFVYSGMKIIKRQEDYLREKNPNCDVVVTQNFGRGHPTFTLIAKQPSKPNQEPNHDRKEAEPLAVAPNTKPRL